MPELTRAWQIFIERATFRSKLFPRSRRACYYYYYYIISVNVGRSIEKSRGKVMVSVWTVIIVRFIRDAIVVLTLLSAHHEPQVTTIRTCCRPREVWDSSFYLCFFSLSVSRKTNDSGCHPAASINRPWNEECAWIAWIIEPNVPRDNRDVACLLLLHFETSFKYLIWRGSERKRKIEESLKIAFRKYRRCSVYIYIEKTGPTLIFSVSIDLPVFAFLRLIDYFNHLF